jgi:hypothetical protein
MSQKRRESYRRARERLAGMTPPEGLKHGPNTWARKIYKCACADCVNPEPRRIPTHNERQKKLREAKRGKPVPPTTTHGIYAYRTYRCKCEICVNAGREAYHRANNPWKYRPTHGRWREENGVTTLCWPPAGAGPEWRCVCDAQHKVSQVRGDRLHHP